MKHNNMQYPQGTRLGNSSPLAVHTLASLISLELVLGLNVFFFFFFFQYLDAGTQHNLLEIWLLAYLHEDVPLHCKLFSSAQAALCGQHPPAQVPKVKTNIQDRYILDLWHPVNREGSHQGETKCIPTTTKFLIHYLEHIPPVEDLEKFGANDVEWAGKAETR